MLASVIERYPVVVARAGLYTPPAGELPSLTYPFIQVEGDDPSDHLMTFRSVLANVPEIERAARGHALVNSAADADGVIRRVPAVAKVGSDVATGLALETLRVALGLNWLTLVGDEHGVVGVRLGDDLLPTDPDGAVTLYFSPPNPERKLSAADVLEGRVEHGSLDGHIVLIGVTALGLTDAPPTPVTGRMDGVEIQAQLIEVLLDAMRLMRPRLAALYEALALAFAGVLLILVLPRLGPLWGLIVTFAIVALLAGGGFGLFVTQRLLFDPSYPVTGVVLVYVLMLCAMLAEGARQRRLLNAELERERIAHARLAGELGAARDIQMGILPDTDAIEGLPPSLRVHAMLEPAREVGGDLYDVFMLDEHRMFFIVGDVSGKGIPASLFMALSKALCRSVALRTEGSVADSVSTANDEISRENPALLFVTAVAGIIDARTGELEYCIAGHDAPIVVAAGREAIELQSVGGRRCVRWTSFRIPATAISSRPAR